MTEPLRDDETLATDDTAERDAQTDAGSSGPGLPPPTAVESLVNALLEAGPEVAEHVVKAAQELLLAVQVIVDAADRAVKEQQTVRSERSATTPPPANDGEGAVRHLDLAE